ncbi:MAG: carboxypeptidase regulatory-like domain-containing protein [Terracidiphilus sp.]
MRKVLYLGCLFAVLGASGLAQDAKPAPSGSRADAGPAQSATGAVAGVVSDSTGAVIVGATVVVHDSTGNDVTVTTDAAGRYLATGLALGDATITVSAQGFADFTTGKAKVTGEKPATADVQMALVASTTSVAVNATRTTEVETENAEVSGTISQEQIVSIGLNGRNFSSLITLSPGVSNQTGQDEAKVGVVGSAKFSVNGGRTEYNTFNVDGNDVLNTDIAASHGHSTLLVYPSLDAIQDMKVLTSNYGAQYGRSASGTVLVSIKGGAERIHGNAYEFIRNELFNTRNYFDAPGDPPLYRRQDFGFTLGGPLSVRNPLHAKSSKTFLFVSEEWRKEQTPYEFNQGVPSDAERGYNLATKSYGNIADFSAVCPDSSGGTTRFSTASYPDCPGQGYGGTKYTYQNNQFYIDPNARALLQDGLIPRANATSGCVSSTGSCFVGSVSPHTDYREDLVRVDHNFNAAWKLFSTIVHDHWTTTTGVPQWAGVTNSFPSVENGFQGPGVSGIAHVTTVITPSLLNDFSVGATWQRVKLYDQAGPGVSLNRSSLNNVPDPIGSFFQNCGGGEVATNYTCIGGKLPGLAFGGTNAEYGGNGFNVDTSYMPWFHTRVVGAITDNVSKFAGRHSLIFGFQVVGAWRHEFGAENGANTGDMQGLLTFRNVSTLNTTGNAFADFEFNNGLPVYSPLYGGQNVYSYQQDNAQSTYKVRYRTYEPYFQDDFKINSRLTVNLGLRVSLFDNWKPDGTVLYNWDPKAFKADLATNSNLALNPLRGFLQDATTGNPLPFDGSTLNPVLTNGLVRCGANGVPESCQTTKMTNLAPRIGLAWDPTGTGKTSIRAGYGVFYEHGTGSEANVGSLMGNPPQIVSMAEQFPFNYASIGSVSIPGGAAVHIQTPLNMVSIPTKTNWPYIQQWSFGIQREVLKDTQVSVAYVGSNGIHLAVASQINQLPPVPSASNPFRKNEPITQELCLSNEINQNNLEDPNAYFSFVEDGTFLYYGPNAAGQPYNPVAFNALVAACDGTQGANGHPSIAYALNYIRPYKGVGNVLAIRNAASSNYNSLQVTGHRVTAPLDLSVSYTYSHSIDSASDRFSSTFVDSYNLAANRASSDFDERQLLNVSYIYQLPLLKLAPYLFAARHWPGASPDPNNPTPAFAAPGRRTKMFLDNWSLSGVTIFQSGTPFSVINSASGTGISVLDNAGLALGENADSYPDLLPHPGHYCPRIRDTGTIGPLIGDPCHFVAPRGLTQGNAGRNFMNNPGRTNFDMALLKEWKVFHDDTLQFRAEAFNIFNHAQFTLYDATRGNTASNTASCYGDETTGYSAGSSQCTAGNGFLHPVQAHRPRTMQFGLKLQF